MKVTIRIFLFAFIVLHCMKSFAQYDALQINLEIFNPKNKKNNRLRLSLYRDDSSLYVISVKNNPEFKNDNYETWLKRDSDTALKISKEDFNSVAEKVIALSSFEVLKGMNPSNPIIWNDGIGVILEMVVNMDKIKFSIVDPNYNTKERNLEPYIVICKEILLLAKMQFKDYF